MKEYKEVSSRGDLELITNWKPITLLGNGK
jgi:hypothetical protein